MNQLIPSLAIIVQCFSPCFRKEAYEMFEQMVCGWILCTGRRTVSRIWETTGLSGKRNHAAAFRLFSSSKWEWDELCCVLVRLLVNTFVKDKVLYVVVDDTLCHKRGVKVAFGGIFRDAVLSSRSYKVFRFGHIWVMLGLVVKIKFREDRYFCIPIFWRLYHKKNNSEGYPHKAHTELALEMVEILVKTLPSYRIVLTGDSMYMGKKLLKSLPENVDVIGPIDWRAALYEQPTADMRSCRKKGNRIENPQQILQDHQRWPFKEVTTNFKNTKKTLLIKTIKDVLWHRSAGYKLLQVVIIHDPDGDWRDEVLMTSDLELSAEEIIKLYSKRWSVELVFADAKQQLGFHDQGVWSKTSVKRCAPMAWFISSLIILWYATAGYQLPLISRIRPWYKQNQYPTFSQMLATCRFQHCDIFQTKQPTSQQGCYTNNQWITQYLATATFS